MTAFRTVREDDNVRVIEGLGIPFGGPFNGRDSYGTYASARTDFLWELFPDSTPNDGTEPRFVRPVTFEHGFDPTIGLRRSGGWSPIRQDEEGIWVQAQLDKRAKYYARIAKLIDKDALAFSSGSAEHSVRFDERTGEWLQWPAYELALTPTESNPYATIAARTGDVFEILQAFSATRRDIPKEERDAADAADFAGPDRSFPILAPEDVSAAAHSLGRASGDTESIKARIIAIAKRKGAAYVAQLPDAWTGEDGARSAVRAGRRNSTADQKGIDAIHDMTVALGTTAHLPDALDEAEHEGEPDEEAAARTGEAMPGLLPELPDLGATRVDPLEAAREIGQRVARERLGMT